TMDTMQVIQIGGGSYLAVYHGGSPLSVRLAGSTDLFSWAFYGVIDPSASQAYLSRASDGSFTLADEKFDNAGASSGASHLYFLPYPSFSALVSAQPDRTFTPPGPRFFSSCNEGTPDIHSISSNGLTLSVGFHYNSDCGPFGTVGLDREAFG